jgi:hypothetical protein
MIILSPEEALLHYKEKCEKLELDLKVAEQDMRDFEVLALEWKKKYAELEHKSRVKIIELEQTIQELEQEKDDFEEFVRRNYSRN